MFNFSHSKRFAVAASSNNRFVLPACFACVGRVPLRWSPSILQAGSASARRPDQLPSLGSWSEKRKEWKFQKTRQTWLLQHMFDTEKVTACRPWRPRRSPNAHSPEMALCSMYLPCSTNEVVYFCNTFQEQVSQSASQVIKQR